jgi:wyosine [tRNA(Phe)-imidazoG37] synthetase (radical SAM superfamily)
VSKDIPIPPRTAYKYLFGPAPSRRLGRSLGVDLVPYKTCTFDCVFREVGVTTLSTPRRREYVPVDEVIAELRDWVKRGGKADYITLSGSGEPTLHTGFGRVLAAIRRMCPIKTALLTNSSLLYLPKVRADAARADLVKVSLSAWDNASFANVNRPHRSITFKKVLSGLHAFRAAFKGKMWLEVVVIAGFNDKPATMGKIARLAADLKPDRVHLNTVVRPPAWPVSGVPRSRMERLARLFKPTAEVIGDLEASACAERNAENAEIVSMLKRRPCTVEDIAVGLGIRKLEAMKAARRLESEGRIRRKKQGKRIYYVCD